MAGACFRPCLMVRSKWGPQGRCALGRLGPGPAFTAGKVFPGLGSTLPKWAVLASFLHCYHLAAGPNAHYLSRNRTRRDSRDPVYKPAAGGQEIGVTVLENSLCSSSPRRCRREGHCEGLLWGLSLFLTSEQFLLHWGVGHSLCSEQMEISASEETQPKRAGVGNTETQNNLLHFTTRYPLSKRTSDLLPTDLLGRGHTNEKKGNLAQVLEPSRTRSHSAI